MGRLQGIGMFSLGRVVNLPFPKPLNISQESPLVSSKLQRLCVEQCSSLVFLVPDKIFQFPVKEMDFPGFSTLSFCPYFSNVAFILILTSCNIDSVGWDSAGIAL